MKPLSLLIGKINKLVATTKLDIQFLVTNSSVDMSSLMSSLP